MSKVRRTAVDLFTPDEHAVLARWFEAKPPDVAHDIVVEGRAAALGVSLLHGIDLQTGSGGLG
jgi:hypothetical protein